MKNFSPKIFWILISVFLIFTFLIFLLGFSYISILGLNNPYSLVIALAATCLVVGLNLIIYFSFDPIFYDSVTLFRRLSRFENLSHPLMLKMSYEAPGTFHHAINVSILAQKAAKAIGANALLIRVAAYYHDLGKLENPTQYIENQSGEEIPKNIDTESIRKDALKIISHVKKGIELAKKNHLPDEIINLIAEHHGTTKMLYFYEIAKERKLKIKTTDFRYDGPAPQSQEAAILMLADSVEAATRSVPNLTLERIKEIVSGAMEEKMAEKQFKNSGLNEYDFAKINRSLIETLSSIYHQRILNQKDAEENPTN